MLALRATAYTSLQEPPVMMIVTERDINVSIDEFIHGPVHDQPGVFFIFDTFAWFPKAGRTPEQSQINLTKKAMERRARTEQVENDMALAYFWFSGHLRMTSDTGTIQTTIVAPMSANRMKVVLEQLAKHPKYKQQTVNTFTEDHKAVTLHPGGRVSIEEIRL